MEADPGEPPPARPGVHIQSSQTAESSGLYTLRSVLKAQLRKEDRDARFYCELSYRLPGGSHMKESREVTVPVFCECRRGRGTGALPPAGRAGRAGAAAEGARAAQTRRSGCGWRWSPRGR